MRVVVSWLLGLAIFSLGFSSLGFSQQRNPLEWNVQSSLEDFDYLANVIRREYVFLEWKSQQHNIDYETHVQSFRAKIAATASDQERFGLMVQFLAPFRDIHLRFESDPSLKPDLMTILWTWS